MSDDNRWLDVWPSMRIEDKERDMLQAHGEVCLHYDISIGDVVMACDDLGIAIEDLRIEVVGAVGGLALRVWVEK